MFDLQTNVGDGDLDIHVEQQLNLLNLELNKLEMQLRNINIQSVIKEINSETMTIQEGEMTFCKPTVCPVDKRQ